METKKLPIEDACEIVGSQAEMARRLGVSPAVVNQWVKGTRPVPVDYCKEIEALTGGTVTVQRLYPKGWDRVWPELVIQPWDGSERRIHTRRKADRAALATSAGKA